VRVQVSRVDLDGRKIDFRLVREGEELLTRALKDKGVSGTARGASGVPAKSSTKRAARKTAADSAKSPIQSLKAAVKKAASKSKTRKTRR
jgi:ribonuclease R